VQATRLSRLASRPPLHNHSLSFRKECLRLPLYPHSSFCSLAREAHGAPAAQRRVHGEMGLRPACRADGRAGDARRRAPRPRARPCRQRRESVLFGINRRPQRRDRVSASWSQRQQLGGGGSDTVKGGVLPSGVELYKLPLGRGVGAGYYVERTRPRSCQALKGPRCDTARVISAYSTLQVSEAFAHVLAKRFATAQLRTSLYMHR
jgi:hypothetical protein